ncbi:concanavalin A-like lectin/glucanase domain-containing protein [Hysterangium stoloniferum]|nr:concanavalin A-like lectin/glucanase domain-containing protein [Hysterangium stoloniferum]
MCCKAWIPALSVFTWLTIVSGAINSYHHHHPLQFSLQNTYIAEDFFDGFAFSTFNDPTHGRVNYLSREDAVDKGLAYVHDQKFVMRADYKNKVEPTARGRDSIRIQSSASWADSVIVLDIEHMPEGCSTWPAFWTISAAGPWPSGGEIDSTCFLSGVNLATQNLVSLHTTPNCTMPDDGRFMMGDSTSNNCDTQFNFNQGCGVNFTDSFFSPSYGSPFNACGGGWYVMERTAESGVFVWFWSRDDSTVPGAVKHGKDHLRPDIFTWGLPMASFPFTETCSSDHFNAHQIIFDDTFCGDFAGALYPTSGCPGNCTDFVDNHPEAFINAFWEINSLRVYTPGY